MERITSAETTDAEQQFERALRPKSFEEFTGQDRVKSKIKVLKDLLP